MICKMKFLRTAVTQLILMIVSLKAAESSIYMSAWDAREPVLRLQRPQPELGNLSIADVFFPRSNMFSLLSVSHGGRSQIDESNNSSTVRDEEIQHHCRDILQAFAEWAAAFTKCLLSYARPFRLCEYCVREYQHTRDIYTAIQNDGNCSQQLLLADTINTIDALYSPLLNLWINADCGECFYAIWENSTTGEVGYNFTRETMVFMEEVHNLTMCFSTSLLLFPEVSDYLPKNVCHACLDNYKHLNNHFENIWSKSNGHVCMDLVDMMNYTRIIWTTVFDCHRPDANATVLIIISVLMTFITALLYLVCRFNAEIRRLRIFKVRRMSSSSRANYGAIGQVGFDNSLPQVASSPSRRRAHASADSTRMN